MASLRLSFWKLSATAGRSPDFLLARALMDPVTHRQREITRRQFFGRGATGIGAAALASLLGRDTAQGAASGALSASRGLPGFPNFAPKARRIIYLLMSGG